MIYLKTEEAGEDKARKIGAVQGGGGSHSGAMATDDNAAMRLFFRCDELVFRLIDYIVKPTASPAPLPHQRGNGVGNVLQGSNGTGMGEPKKMSIRHNIQNLLHPYWRHTGEGVVKAAVYALQE